MKFIWNKKPWAITLGVSTALFGIMLAATYFGDTYANAINTNLGITTSKIVDDELTSEDTEYYKSNFDSYDELNAWQQDLNEQIQGEGSVLIMNNNNALPVDMTGGVGVSTFGRSSSDLIYGGTGSGSVDTSNAATVLSSFTDAGFTVNESLLNWYSSQISALQTNGVDRSTGGMWTEYDALGDATRLAEIDTDLLKDANISYDGYDDLAVIVIGRSGGEGSDLPHETFSDGTAYFELQAEEKELIEYVTETLNFDKTIVLINSSNAMALDWLDEYDIDAALWIGGPGQYGMNSVAKIISGEINPSGRFVDTYAKSSLSSPAIVNQGGYTYANADVEDGSYTGTIAGQTIDGAPLDNTAVRYAIHYLVEEESIYVGYKYYETRYEDAVLGDGNASGNSGITAGSGTSWSYVDEVDYAFGYGLSYTTFTQELEGVTYNEENDTYEVEVTVTNTGDTPGKEVVQVYAQTPYTDFDKSNNIEKASVQLVGFGKTSELEANGGSETVTVEVDKKELTVYDSFVNETYILEAGTYYLSVGYDAHDALNNILDEKGYSTSNSTVMDDDGDEDMVYKWTESTTDTTTYSVSEVTGNDIENQFDAADLNYYDDYNQTYLSRQDWVGTYPQGYDRTNGLSASSDLIHDLNFNYEADTSAADDVVYGSTATSLNIVMMHGLDYDDPLWDDLVSQLTLEEMADLIGNSGAGSSAITSINLPATSASDGPQGLNAIIGDQSTVAYTSEVVMASTFNEEILYNIGKSMGEDAMLISGDTLNVWYGPAMNIHRTPYSGRNFEYYSEDSFLSGKMAANEVKGAQEMGLITLIKHFAVNDFETYRQSVATFATEQAIREIYLEPFEYAVVEGGSMGVMSSFNRIGARWAGAHEGLLTNVLRGEWGFEGFVATDAVMANRNWMDITIGLDAGGDLWLTTSDWLVSSLVTDSQTDSKLLRNMVQAAKNILYAYANSTAINGLSSSSRVVQVTPAWQVAIYTFDWIFGIVAVASAGLLVACEVKSRFFKD